MVTSDVITLDIDLDKLVPVTIVPSVLNDDITIRCPLGDGEIVGGVGPATVIADLRLLTGHGQRRCVTESYPVLIVIAESVHVLGILDPD